MKAELAIFGGKAQRDTYLPYGRQSISIDDERAVLEILRGDYLTTGPTIELFEKEIASYVGTKYAVAFSNGTAALHAASFAAGIGTEDEVIVTPMSFAASANCILYCGGEPIFSDICKDTLNLDIDKIEDKITAQTKMIIPVAFAGQTLDMDKLMNLADKHNLTVLLDAAHALGSKYKGFPVGRKADMTMFSFHPVKPVTTGEGGVIVTNNKDYYQKLKLFCSHGITRDRALMEDDHGPWYYEQLILGYNYRLTDMQAALGISQMKRLDDFILKRRNIVSYYNESLKDLDALNIPIEKNYSESGYHLYVIQLQLDKLNANRKEIFEALQAENIGVNVHYLPIYLLPYYKKLGYKKGLCPISEEVYESIITLPLFPEMTMNDAQDVVCAVKKVLNFYEKKN